MKQTEISFIKKLMNQAFVVSENERETESILIKKHSLKFLMSNIGLKWKKYLFKNVTRKKSNSKKKYVTKILKFKNYLWNYI